jgi:hypothetical protein
MVSYVLFNMTFAPITKPVMFILMCSLIAYDQTLIPTPNLGLL